MTDTNTPDRSIKFTYTNWQGKTSERHVTPVSIRWGSTGWHPYECWLMLAWDHDKEAEREFSLVDFASTRPSPAVTVPPLNFEPLRQWGFAPGSYSCLCSDCGKMHNADKRAWRCLICAEKKVSAIQPTDTNARVEALREAIDEAHALLTWRYQVFMKPPSETDGRYEESMKVWNLEAEARDHMGAGEVALFDALLALIDQPAPACDACGGDGCVATDQKDNNGDQIERACPLCGVDQPAPSPTPQTIPEDLLTHHPTWRKALILAIRGAEIPPSGIGDRAYWTHELAAFDRAFYDLRALSEDKS